jgi:hypothetical protein
LGSTMAARNPLPNTVPIWLNTRLRPGFRQPCLTSRPRNERASKNTGCQDSTQRGSVGIGPDNEKKMCVFTMAQRITSP